MAMALDQARARRNPALALRFAARELRGGLRGGCGHEIVLQTV